MYISFVYLGLQHFFPHLSGPSPDHEEAPAITYAPVGTDDDGLLDGLRYGGRRLPPLDPFKRRRLSSKESESENSPRDFENVL